MSLEAPELTPVGPRTPLVRLSELFYERFFYNDLISADEDPQLAAANVMAVLVFPGLLCLYWVPKYYVWLALAPPQEIAVHVFGDRLLWMTFSMAMLGLVATLQWERLFPDRRDYLILGPQPVPTHILFGAQARALTRYLAIFLLCINLGAALFFPLATVPWKAGFLEGAHYSLAHWFSLIAGGAFTLLFVMSVQALLANLTPARLFNRISPIAQALLAGCFLATAVAAPVLRSFAVADAASIAEIGEVNDWTWLTPPMLFSCLGETLAGRGSRFFATHATDAMALLALSAVATGTGYLFGYRRFLRRSLEAPGASAWSSSRTAAALGRRLILRVLPDADEQAVCLFTIKALMRSPSHRLYVAGFLAVAAAIGFVQMVSVEDFAEHSPTAAAQPYMLLFAALAGMRVVFATPAEWSANWAFRFHTTKRMERYLAGIRKAVWAVAPIPLVVVSTAVAAAFWGWAEASTHLILFLLAACVSVELALLRFWKIPFACGYTAGRAHVIILWTFCVVGMLTYSQALAHTEIAASDEPWRLAAYCVLVAAAFLVWRPVQGVLAERSGGPIFEESGSRIVEIGINR